LSKRHGGTKKKKPPVERGKNIGKNKLIPKTLVIARFLKEFGDGLYDFLAENLWFEGAAEKIGENSGKKGHTFKTPSKR